MNTDPTTPEGRAQLRELLAATTSPGKWVALGNSIGAEVDGCTCGVPGAGYLAGHEPHCGLEGPVLMQAHEDDAKLIAAAVNALPALLDDADRYEALAAHIRTEIARHERRAAAYRRKAMTFWAGLTQSGPQLESYARMEDTAADRLRALLEGEAPNEQ